ncbi:MAG: hypothetical protein H6Q60_440 [Oscillospiraceae bacterium]|nr:hypothetical protein [Oscillospiraceae bacterium]
MKRIFSACLAVLLCCGAAVTPAWASSSSFSDITDTSVAEAAETLRLLGIVQGSDDGLFHPGDVLTRASFCKMAILADDRGSEAGLQKGRVIFSDVTADNWALGYINAAASGTSPLVRGSGDGSFRPDSAVTYGQAAAILMRLLGYGDSDVAAGVNWYDGYLSLADSIGLTDGVTAGGGDIITRGQAAILFENLLYATPKDASSVFLETTLGGSVVSDVVLLSATDTTVKISGATYQSERSDLKRLKGYTVDLYLNSSGHVIAARSSESATGTSKTVTVSEFEATYVKLTDGTSISVNSSTEFWEDSTETTYADVYLDLTAGATITFYFDADGTVERMTLLDDGDTVKNGYLTALTGSNPFSSLTGSDTFTILKNGVTASRSDLRIYDVGSYNVNTQVLTVSDEKITGVLESASPSVQSASTITVLGHAFSVLSCATDSIASCSVGDAITLLLDSDNQVAGVVPASTVSTKALGLVTEVSYPTVTVTLISGIKVTGTATAGSSYINALQGKLATVTSTEKGYLSVYQATGKGAAFTGDWKVADATLGSLKVSSGAEVYERVGDSKLYDVGLDQVTVKTISADDISYVGLDYAGRVNLLILENVTGDCYTYGLLDYTKGTTSDDISPDLNSTVTVENSSSSNSTLITGMDLGKKDGLPVGIVGQVYANSDGHNRMEDIIFLTAVTKVNRSAFSDDTVTVNGVDYPISENVQCYNADSETWFSSLTAARAYAKTLTVYYDKPASEGGKIRLVVAGTLDS